MGIWSFHIPENSPYLTKIFIKKKKKPISQPKHLSHNSSNHFLPAIRKEGLGTCLNKTRSHLFSEDSRHIKARLVPMSLINPSPPARSGSLAATVHSGGTQRLCVTPPLWGKGPQLSITVSWHFILLRQPKSTDPSNHPALPALCSLTK